MPTATATATLPGATERRRWHAASRRTNRRMERYARATRAPNPDDATVFLAARLYLEAEATQIELWKLLSPYVPRKGREEEL